jgi:hypothetical protein
MDHIRPEFFNNKLTVGCNFVYNRFPCTYTVTRHMKVIREFGQDVPVPPPTVLVHSRFTTDLGGFEIPAHGYVFHDELLWTRGIMATAMDFARYLGASRIIVFGAESSMQYMTDYTVPKDVDAMTVYMETNRANIAHAVEWIELKYNIPVFWIR